MIVGVDYLLKEVNEAFDSESLNGGAPSDEDLGLRNICGLLSSTRCDLLHEHFGLRLTLQLEDGRLLDFAVTQKRGTKTCLVHNLGDFRENEKAPSTPRAIAE